MIKNVGFGLLALFGALFLGACNDEGSLGLDLLPNADGIGVHKQDTFTVVTYTVDEDSVQSQFPSRHIMGEVNDPIFGNAKAGSYMQLLLATENINLGTNITIDSLVFSMVIDSYMGDTTQELNVRVYELNESLSPDSTYFTSRKLAVKPAPIGSATLTIRPNTRTEINEPLSSGGDTVIAYQSLLRVRLDNALAQRIVSASGTADLANNANWLNFFKGIYLEASVASGQPGIMVNLTPRTSLNGMFLYYKNDTIRRRFDMAARGNIGFYNFFDFDYTGATVASAIGNTSPLIEENYVQAGTGLKMRIDIPYLKELVKNFDVAINKAEIEVSVIPASATTERPAPTRMFLLPADSLNANQISGMDDINELYYDGNLKSEKYRFGITRYVQRQLRSSQPDYGLRLIPINTVSTVNRAVIASSNHPNPLLRPKLIITFTKLK